MTYKKFGAIIACNDIIYIEYSKLGRLCKIMKSYKEKNIMETYSLSHQKSFELYKRACQALPGGATHDSRFLNPFPIYVEKASGSKKWDVDGNEYVDYWMGHGALLLGHSRPEIVEAV